MHNANHLVVRSVTVLIYAALAFMVLSFLLALTFPLIVNPNNYTAQMADKVLERTGRTLTFASKIDWDLFPEPTLTMAQLSLSNAPGFPAAPMIQIQRLQGRLSLRHLLHLQFELEDLSASGVEVFLESESGGRNNWDDLVTRLAAAGTEEKVGAASPDDLPDDRAAHRPTTTLAQLGVRALAALSNRAITLREGSVHACHQERSERACLHLTRLAFTPQMAGSGRRPVVQIQGEIQIPDPAFVGQVTLSYRQTPQTDQAVTQWPDTKVTVRGRVNMPPAKELELVWHSDVTMGPEPNRVYITHPDSRLTVWNDAALFREFTLTMKGDAEADLSTGKVHLPQGGVGWRVKSDHLPPAGVGLLFQSPIEMDWRQGTLHMARLQAIGPAQMRLEGQLRVQQLLTRPDIDAELTVSRFDPRALLVALGRSVPPTSDPTVIQSASGSAAIHLDDRVLLVRDMTLTVDDTRIVGSLQWGADGRAETGKAAIRFDLQGDRLDLGRYLPPLLTDPDNAGVMERALVAPEVWLPELPVHGVHGLDVQGTLRLGEVQTASGRATDLLVEVDAFDRQLRVHPYRMNVHDGQIETRVLWDERGDEPQLTVDKSVTGVQVEPILRSLPNGRWLTGRADLTVHLVTQGRQPEWLRKNLNGVLTLTLREGTLQGVDLVERFREAHSVASQESRAFAAGPEKSGTDKRGVTPFSQITATGSVAAGVIDNKDLQLVSSALYGTGKGWLDLSRAAVQYTLEVDGFVPGRSGGSGASRLVLPLRVQGDWHTLKAPVFLPMRSQKLSDQGYL